jgi:hypothetical protein
MFRRYLSFLKIASDDFSDIVVNAELHADRVRLFLIDGSRVDVRYPIEDKFSFHWQRGDMIYRIDTAPHHKGIRTFPRHIHFGSEDNIIEDSVLGENGSPEEKFKRFMEWVSELLRRS